MSKNLRLFLATLLLFFIFAIFSYKTKSQEIFLPKEISQDNFTISGEAKIIDGDSIIIKQYEIRLYDIDAPEYKQHCQDKNNKSYKCGINSLLFLKKLTKGKTLNCKTHGKDYYDRYLSTCYHDKFNINKAMIESGNAVIYSSDSIYYPEEQKAKLEKIGIWQGDFLLPKIYRKINRK